MFKHVAVRSMETNVKKIERFESKEKREEQRVKCDLESKRLKLNVPNNENNKIKSEPIYLPPSSPIKDIHFDAFCSVSDYNTVTPKKKLLSVVITRVGGPKWIIKISAIPLVEND